MVDMDGEVRRLRATGNVVVGVLGSLRSRSVGVSGEACHRAAWGEQIRLRDDDDAGRARWFGKVLVEDARRVGAQLAES